MPAPSVMESFQLGQAGGVASSPVTGIGIAIKRVVEDAQKKGLLQAQSQFQGESSDQVNQLKEGRETERGKVFQDTIIPGATEAQDRTISAPASTTVQSPQKPDSTAALAEAIKSALGGDKTKPPVDSFKPKVPGGELVPNAPPEPAAVAQPGDEELIQIRFKDGTLSNPMTKGQARALNYPVD